LVAASAVYLDGNQKTLSNPEGIFIFPSIANGEHTLQIISPDFRPVKRTIVIAGKNEEIVIYLSSRDETLNEVVVSDKKTDFGFQD